MSTTDTVAPQHRTMQRQGWYDGGRVGVVAGALIFVLVPELFMTSNLLQLGYFGFAFGVLAVLVHFFYLPTTPFIFYCGTSGIAVGIVMPAFYVWGKGDLTTAMTFAVLGAALALDGWRLLYLATRPYRGPAPQ